MQKILDTQIAFKLHSFLDTWRKKNIVKLDKTVNS